MEKLLTPQQLGQVLQVKLSTVYKWVHYGYIPSIKLGSVIRFKASAIEKWVTKKQRKGRDSIE